MLSQDAGRKVGTIGAAVILIWMGLAPVFGVDTNQAAPGWVQTTIPMLVTAAGLILTLLRKKPQP